MPAKWASGPNIYIWLVGFHRYIYGSKLSSQTFKRRSPSCIPRESYTYMQHPLEIFVSFHQLLHVIFSQPTLSHCSCNAIEILLASTSMNRMDLTRLADINRSCWWVSFSTSIFYRKEVNLINLRSYIGTSVLDRNPA